METTAVSVSFESRSIVYLSAVEIRDEQVIARAASTGFFWRRGDRIYLITARHCITGRDQNNKRIGTFDPTHLQIYFTFPAAKADPDVTFYKNERLAAVLWKDGEPEWYEHDDGSKIDVAALDFSDAGFDVNCVNDKQQIASWELEVGADCFIVGYPDALHGSQGTPIWKRASIASEPNLEFDGLPIFLCDSATRKGLSGAPVFAKLQGLFGQEGKPLPSQGPKFFGHWTKFIGVYSGRNGPQQDGFQLGRVWKAEVIEEILEARRKAESPFVQKNM